MNANQRFRKVREDKGLSQAALGKVLGISRDVVNNIEHDRARIADDTLGKMSATLHVNMNWMLSGIGEMYLSPTDFNGDSPKDVALQVVADLLDHLPDTSADLVRSLCLEYLNALEKKSRGDSKGNAKLDEPVDAEIIEST